MKNTQRDLAGGPRTIAIDGPAAAGKSTIAARLAAACGYHVLDTGLIYRALTALALHDGVNLEDGQGLVDLLERRPLRLVLDEAGRDFKVLAGGHPPLDLTAELRTPAVDAAVSAVSRHPAVRAALLPVQRQARTLGPLVMVGRDIGTVVLPDAELKIYLDASPEERARRRHLEASARDPSMTYDTVLDGVLRRDELDSSRAISPLKAAPDAVRVPTDGLSIDEVVAAIVGHFVPAAGDH